jgi:hypothetical protein
MRVDGITEIERRLERPPPIHVGGGNEMPAAMRVDGITEIGQRLAWPPPGPCPQNKYANNGITSRCHMARPLGRVAATSGGERAAASGASPSFE